MHSTIHRCSWGALAVIALFPIVPAKAVAPIHTGKKARVVSVDAIACRGRFVARRVLSPASRRVRQVTLYSKDLTYDGPRRTLRGVSRAVTGGPRHLRIYLPDRSAAKRTELSDGPTAKTATGDNLLTVDFTASTGAGVVWKVFF